MGNIIYNGIKYNRVFLNDDNTIIKFSPMDIEGWNLLKQKDLPFLNTPLAYRKINDKERKRFFNCLSKIKLEFLKDYITLSNLNVNNLTKKEVLNLLKRLLSLIKIMHNNNVIHSDLNPDNIMINNNLDFQIIDLDSSIVDEFVSDDNIYKDEESSLEEKIIESINDDKLDILCLLIYYLINDTFKGRDIRSLSNSNCLILPKDLKKEIDSYLSLKRQFTRYYYFEDIIDELEKIDIEKNTKVKRF